MAEPTREDMKQAKAIIKDAWTRGVEDAIFLEQQAADAIAQMAADARAEGAASREAEVDAAKEWADEAYTAQYAAEEDRDRLVAEVDRLRTELADCRLAHTDGGEEHG